MATDLPMDLPMDLPGDEAAPKPVPLSMWRKCVKPIMDVVKDGITPSELAKSIAIGVIGGVWPICGTQWQVA